MQREIIKEECQLQFPLKQGVFLSRLGSIETAPLSGETGTQSLLRLPRHLGSNARLRLLLVINGGGAVPRVTSAKRQKLRRHRETSVSSRLSGCSSNSLMV